MSNADKIEQVTAIDPIQQRQQALLCIRPGQARPLRQRQASLSLLAAPPMGALTPSPRSLDRPAWGRA